MRSIYFGHDHIYFNQWKGEKIKPLPQDYSVRELLRGKHHSTPVNHVQPLFNLEQADDRDLVFIIPNQAYENKSIYNLVHQWLCDWVDSPTIISEIEAITAYLIRQQKGEGIYRVVNIGQHSLQIHELEIAHDQFFHLHSQEFDWNNPCSIQQLRNKQGECFFTQQSVLGQIELINQIWQEELSTLEPKYHQYRIDYSSKVTFKELINTASKLAESYASTINQFTTLKPPGKVYYFGTLSTWDGFRSLLDASYTFIDWNSLLNVEYSHVPHYPKLNTALELCMFGIEKKWVTVLDSGYTYTPGLKADSSVIPALKNVRIPIISDQDSVLRLHFKYGNREYKGVLDLSKAPALASATIKTNGFYKWIEADLSVALDGCSNIVVAVSQDSRLLHTATISKLKKHE